MHNGLQWKAKHNGNIAVSRNKAGRLPFMGGSFRPLKEDGLYFESRTSSARYQRDPFSGALVKA
jgi:hypothetical protein